MSTASTLLARFQRWTAPRAEPSLTALLLLELVAIFVAVPLSNLDLWPAPANAVLRVALFLVALVVVSQHRTFLFITVAALTTTIISTGRTSDGRVLENADIVAQLCLWAVLSWVVGRALFAPGRVTHHRIQGAFALYLQLALLFAYAYLLLAVHVPDAFSPPVVIGRSGDPSALLHFSFVTLTSTGYGDIVPVYPIARSLADLEAMVGQFYVATLLARLVTLEMEHAGHAPRT